MPDRVFIALSSRTAHVPDLERSIPPEFDESGRIIRGGVVTKPVPPWTPFEVDAAEAERLLSTHTGVRIPLAGEADPVAWLRAHADELGMPLRARGALAHG